MEIKSYYKFFYIETYKDIKRIHIRDCKYINEHKKIVYLGFFATSIAAVSAAKNIGLENIRCCLHCCNITIE